MTEPIQVEVVGPVTIVTLGYCLLLDLDRVDVRTLPQKERSSLVSFTPSGGTIDHRIGVAKEEPATCRQHRAACEEHTSRDVPSTRGGLRGLRRPAPALHNRWGARRNARNTGR